MSSNRRKQGTSQYCNSYLQRLIQDFQYTHNSNIVFELTVSLSPHRALTSAKSLEPTSWQR
jgi:hypothetical protein